MIALLLVLLVAFVRPSLGFWKNDNCYHSIRQRNGTPSDKLVKLMKDWIDPALMKENGFYEGDCVNFFLSWHGCQTFSCKKANGNDLFVFNSCAPEKYKCSGELYDICTELSGTPNCTTCDGWGNCNKRQLELQTPNPRTTAANLVTGETSTDGAADNKSPAASPAIVVLFGANRPPIKAPSNGACGATLYSSTTTTLLLFAFLLL
uniref:Secreted protein n=1 Tax=Globodera pallida TaxID=36090 RepID=A0A183BXQ0_GLOPA